MKLDHGLIASVVYNPRWPATFRWAARLRVTSQLMPIRSGFAYRVFQPMLATSIYCRTLPRSTTARALNASRA